MADIQIEPKCPNCKRITVDNKQHCADKKAQAWATSCRWMVCITCKFTYGPVGWPGFPYVTGKITGGSP